MMSEGERERERNMEGGAIVHGRHPKRGFLFSRNVEYLAEFFISFSFFLPPTDRFDQPATSTTLLYSTSYLRGTRRTRAPGSPCLS